jgi:uncharacterized protein (DUF1499 family)
MIRKIAVGAGVGLAIAVASFAYLAALSFFSKRPSNLGLVDSRLRACPNSPNCVCTQATDEAHRIEPLRFTGSGAEALERLKQVLGALPRTKIVTANADYMHVEFTTMVLRFVDDVEFAIDEKTRTIHFRSASRVGHSDLGVNRRRMEAIRAAFEKS